MKTLLVTLSLIGSFSASACDSINFGKPGNDDCKEIAVALYAKAKAPEYSVSQAIYTSSWSESAKPNLTILLGNRMVFAKPGKMCTPDYSEQCLAKSAMGIFSYVGTDPEYKVNNEDDAWISAKTEGYYYRGYHLKQSGKYLVGYWEEPAGQLFFITSLDKDKLDVALPQ